MIEPSAIPIRHLRRDGGTQPRDHISLEVARDYAEAIADGTDLPPVTVFYDGLEYWLADGYHRVLAHETLGRTEIYADVHQGTRREAVLYSVGANAAHGLPRTNQDKRRAVVTLLNDPEWAAWSDREIARRCRVSAPLVASLRPAQEFTVNSGSDKVRTFIDRHGNASHMRVEAIGKPKREMPTVAGRQCERRPRPDYGRSEEACVSTAQAITGLSKRHITEMARGGEIDGAYKDGGSWVFPTASLVQLVEVSAVDVEPVDVAPEPVTFDHDAGALLLAIADTVERIAGWPSVAEALAIWRRDIGAAPDTATIDAAARWLAEFAAEWPTVAAERSNRIAQALQGA